MVCSLVVQAPATRGCPVTGFSLQRCLAAAYLAAVEAEQQTGPASFALVWLAVDTPHHGSIIAICALQCCAVRVCTSEHATSMSAEWVLQACAALGSAAAAQVLA